MMIKKNGAIAEYKINANTFWKDWDELTEEEKNTWYRKYAEKYGINEGCVTYNEYVYDRYGLEYFEHHYTTEHGDKVVAFGLYGYDG